MLVLSRKTYEVIVIEGGIEVTVVEIRGDKVRLGITAPPHVTVDRKEIYESKRSERRSNGSEETV